MNRQAAYKYKERRCVEEDAQRQAKRLMWQHSLETARRVAAETALGFHPHATGRVFWQTVLEILNEVSPLE